MKGGRCYRLLFIPFPGDEVYPSPPHVVAEEDVCMDDSPAVDAVELQASPAAPATLAEADGEDWRLADDVEEEVAPPPVAPPPTCDSVPLEDDGDMLMWW